MLLTFDFKTVEEAQAFLLKNFTNQTAEVLVERATNPTATEVKEPLEKKKRGPKPKAKEPEKVYGIEDCRTALSGLFDAKGRDAAKAALAEFKVARIGELKPDQYRGFIVTCETSGQPE